MNWQPEAGQLISKWVDIFFRNHTSVDNVYICSPLQVFLVFNPVLILCLPSAKCKSSNGVFVVNMYIRGQIQVKIF